MKYAAFLLLGFNPLHANEDSMSIKGYPIEFERYDILGDGNCGCYAAGIPLDECHDGIEPDELITKAKRRGIPVTIYVDPHYQEEDFNYKAVYHTGGDEERMIHLYYGPSDGASKSPHYQLLVDPKSPNALNERTRGHYLSGIKDVHNISHKNKALGCSKMQKEHHKWVVQGVRTTDDEAPAGGTSAEGVDQVIIDGQNKKG